MTEAPSRADAARASRGAIRRIFFRRQFYLQLARLAMSRPRRGATFVTLMGGLGDLINAFPSIEALAERGPIDMGTGGPPYRTLVEANPRIRTVYAPFVYKPARPAHRRLITRVTARVYERVVLLDSDDPRWWTHGEHLLARYARACGVPPASHGRVHVRPEHHATAQAHLERLGLRDYIYVVQLVRRRRPLRSWPLEHYHALYAALRRFTDVPIVVDTTGSDERAIPGDCIPLGALGMLPACAAVQRARLFIGPDTGLTHAAGVLGTPTVAIHVGFPAETCAARGPRVRVVRQAEPFTDPKLTTPEQVFEAVERTW